MSNVESLLTAILTSDAKYIVKPQSRVEELLLAIYNNGGGGGGGEHIDPIARRDIANLAGVVETLAGKITTIEGELTETELAKILKNTLDTKYEKPNKGIPSSDMTQAVQDSLGKADTALQASDKEELQDAIDDVDENKLNKTAVLSEIPSSLSPDAVLSAQLSLDTFTKKVTTEAVANNTRIVEVPENVDCFAGIGMIGGKTQKTKNFYDCLKTEPYSAEKETVTTTENSVRVVMSKAGTYGASKFVYSFTVGKSYTLSADVTISSGTARLAVRTADNTVKAGTNPITANGHYTTTFTATSDMSFVSLFATWDSAITGDVTYSNIMLVEGNAEIPYEPYHAELWNAPVTAIESAGKNLFDKSKAKVGKRASNTGAIIDGTGFDCSDYIPVSANTNYYLTDVTGVGVFYTNAFYDKDKKFISNVNISGASRVSGSILSPSNAEYMIINFMHTNIDTVMVERGTTTTGYVPYVNKTTISLSDIVKNLPDYGCSAGEVYNYIDFEDGYYHHRVGKVDLANVSFNSYNDGYAWAMKTSDVTLINIKKVSPATSVANVVSEKYETTYISGNHHMTIPNSIGVGTSGQIFCNNGSTTEKPSGIIYYEYETEELIPLSSILPPIHVEPNGTLEFVNEHNLDVPSKTIYKKTV